MIMKFHVSLLMTSLDLLEKREGHLTGTKKFKELKNKQTINY